MRERERERTSEWYRSPEEVDGVDDTVQPDISHTHTLTHTHTHSLTEDTHAHPVSLSPAISRLLAGKALHAMGGLLYTNVFVICMCG